MIKFLSGEKQGSLYAIFSGLLYGLVGFFGITIMNAQFSVYNMLFWRFLISGSFVGLILLLRRKTVKESAANMLKVFFLGAVFYSMTSIFFFMASRRIGTGLAMVISFTFPTIVIFLNWMFDRQPIAKIEELLPKKEEIFSPLKEAVRLKPLPRYKITCLDPPLKGWNCGKQCVHIRSIALITTGLVLLVDFHEFKFDLVGIGLGILCAVFYALYVFTSKKSAVSPLASTLMVSSGCASANLLFALIDGSFIVPITASVWENLFGMAIICTALPILLLLKALKHISSEKTSILSVLEPIFVVLFGFLLLREKISLLQALGMVIVLTGAMITLLKSLQLAKPGIGEWR